MMVSVLMPLTLEQAAATARRSVGARAGGGGERRRLRESASMLISMGVMRC
jgi:hypothetical protein